MAALLLTACEGSDSYQAGYRAGQGGVAYSQCGDLADISSMQDGNIDVGDFTDGCEDAAGRPSVGTREKNSMTPVDTAKSIASLSTIDGDALAGQMKDAFAKEGKPTSSFDCPKGEYGDNASVDCSFVSAADKGQWAVTAILHFNLGKITVDLANLHRN